MIFSLGLLALAVLPAALTWRNLQLFQRAPESEKAFADGVVKAEVESDRAGVSVLIPARDEEAGIRDAVESVLANVGVSFEIIVLDDQSTDRTAEIVQSIAAGEPSVRLERSIELPDGWNGKQHACWQLSQLASYETLLFLDADVRLSRDALTRLQLALEQSGADLLSGFPAQVTESLAERLLIPMMYVVLLGYLPLDQMRASTKPEFGAGCGQLFAAKKKAYLECDGHRAIRGSRHDGVKLPRSFRAAGFMTDLFDASDIARVRMYEGWGPVSRGLLKNANEGIANSKLILIFTVLLLGHGVLPVLFFPHAIYHQWPPLAIVLLGVATLLSFAPRFFITLRLGRSWIEFLLHPLAVALFVGLQWVAFVREVTGQKAIAWRGRS